MNTNKHEFRIAALFLGLAVTVSAAPEFDAASVRANKTPGKRGDLSFTPGRFTATALNLRSIILAAFDLKEYQLSGGPAWITSEAYDIAGTAAGPATPTELKVMLQTLLKDRFQLAIHREQKELPIYALVVGKNGPKLTATEGTTETRLATTGVGLTFKSTSMAGLAVFLTNLSPVEGRPVLDRTGLGGTFDFTLLVSEVQANSLAPDETKKTVRDWPSLFADLQQQLGLKLESQKAATEFLVIDGVARPPEN